MSDITNNIQTGINHLMENDSCLRKIIEANPQCNLKPQRKYFLRLVEIIIAQQLSVRAAATIYKRFTSYYQGNISSSIILSTSDETLRNLGISTNKVKFIKDIAQKIENKQLNLKGIISKSEEEISRELIQVKGIGVWSIHMFLMFTLCRLDVLPVGDLGIRKAVQNIYKLKSLPDEQTIAKIAKKNRWSPYSSIASWYLWRSLDNK